jgi:hypothetical protein|tara:strand:+ start:987 stop:1244 length:258 start_codon:yes stop_codon:yes gene_type:complete
MPKKKRNYRKEYDNYQGKKKQKKRRASRNASRATMKKKGKVSKGDGKDVHHRDGNPKNKKASNLKVTSKSKNRSFKRTKNARKKA